MTDTVIPLHTTNNATLQFFLTENPLGVCEVGPHPVDATTFRLRCTCPTWKPEGEETCEHAAYVAARILTHPNKYYPCRVLGGLKGTGLNTAMRDPWIMRHWLIHFAEIVVS